MTFGTLRQRILRALFQDVDAPATKTIDDINLAVVEAINYHKALPLGFNEIEDEIDVVDDIKVYDWPAEFEGMTTFALYQQTDSDVIQKVDLYPVQFMKEVTLTHGLSVYDGPAPVRWMAIDNINEQFVLGPGMPLAGTITYRYIADIGTISAEYSAGAWAYTTVAYGAIDTDTFECAWFNEGFHLIYHRALYLLWSELYGGTEEAKDKTQLALAKWNDEYSRIKTRMSFQSLTTKIKGYI